MSGGGQSASGALMLTFCPMNRADIPAVLRMTRENMAQVIHSSWGVDYTDETLLDAILDDWTRTEVLRHDTEIVGYYALEQRGDYAFIVSIQVRRECQGKGLGKAMMEKIETEAQEAGLDGVELCVQSTNRNAKNFYEHLEYRFISRQRNNLLLRKQFPEDDWGVA